MATFFVVDGAIYNLQNAPDPTQQYYYLDFDQDDPGALPGQGASGITVPYWAQDDFSFDITFTVEEVADDTGGNTEIWVVTNTSYDGVSYGTGSGAATSGDFFQGTSFSSVGDPEQIDSVSVEAIENPFKDEFYHIEQNYGDDSTGDINNRFNEEGINHRAETNLDAGYLNVDTFAYVPPEDQVFKKQTNTYQLQELEDVVEEGGEQSKFLGISEWQLPSDRFLEIVHSFTLTAVGQTTGNIRFIPYTVYHESHWNFNKAKVFAEKLQNELAILKPNDTDQTFEEAQSVEPDNPEYDLDTEFVGDYFPDVETITSADGNTQPLDANSNPEDIAASYDDLIGVPRIEDPNK
jgi:hypothetical protein